MQWLRWGGGGGGVGLNDVRGRLSTKMMFFVLSAKAVESDRLAP